MSSPTRGPVRRRQRSARAAVACLLLAAAALAVVGAALSGSWPLLTIAAVGAVALGATATRIAYLEVLQSRREAATDRAELAQQYRTLTDERTGENAVFVAEMTGRIGRHEATIERLEKRFAEAAEEVFEAHRLLDQAVERAQLAEAEGERLAARLEEAEERAAQSLVRVAELEQELDVLTAEWQAVEALRKHA
jgi:chromosome segregation ATPase